MGFQNFKACLSSANSLALDSARNILLPREGGIEFITGNITQPFGGNFWYISCPGATLCQYVNKQYLERLSDSSLAIVIDCLCYSIHSKHHLCTVVQCQSLLIYHLLLLILLNPAALLLIELIRMPSPHLNSRTKKSIRDEGCTTLWYDMPMRCLHCLHCSYYVNCLTQLKQ